MNCKTFLCAWLLTLAFVYPVLAQHELVDANAKPSDNVDAVKQMKAIRKPSGIDVSLFAAEPSVKNPVAFYVDHQGKVFVCESFRQGKGIEDNRNHRHWLHDDLAAQTVEDRLKYIKKHLGDKAEDYTKEDDRIRLLVDSNNDGAADNATVFSKGYNTIVSGTGAGVLNYQGNVYYTCIPDLWLINDKDHDGVGETRTALHTGFGVRFAFRGHDMHGLVIGPDGRLYFSIGDRGYNVKTDNGEIADPASGAVFRCELDGSNLEVIHTGLRNPQELAFDNYGNLFTGDNNSDSGDKARWVYVVPGGDSGWRMYYQYLPDRGPFNREEIWHPFSETTPAYIVPPVANISDGPSGLTFYPGTGFGDRFKDCFLLCDFRGQSSNSGIRSFRVANDGAFFRVVDSEQPFWQVLATDADFGPDGKLYVSDWVHGWTGESKGRLYTFFDANAQKTSVVAEVAEILKNGLRKRNDLDQLIDHPDRRIRQEAQFELVRRNDAEQLEKSALKQELEYGRYHAIWGLAQLSRMGKLSDQRAAAVVLKLLSDDKDEPKFQAMKLAADAKLESIADNVAEALTSENARVRFGAAICLGRLEAKQFATKIFEMLANNADQDPLIRHAGIMALTWFNDDGVFGTAIKHPSSSVRLAAVVAMRKTRKKELSLALNDADQKIVLEAARAIHDLNIESEFPRLAALANKIVGPDPLLRRVMNANFRIGNVENAQAIAVIAANQSIEEGRRIDALDMLSTWNNPQPLDRVLGMWRPLSDRRPIEVATIVKKALPSLVASSGKVSTKALMVAGDLNISDVQPLLSEVLFDIKQNEQSRAAALSALIKLRSNKSSQFVLMGLESTSELIKQTALELAPNVIPDRAFEYISKSLDSENVATSQAAIRALGQLKNEQASQAINVLAGKLLSGKLRKELSLDVFEQVEKHQSQMKDLFNQIKAIDSNNKFAAYRYSDFGGDAERGNQIFYQWESTSCLRCHKINDRGGEVGPELTEIAKTKSRQYLLNSIISPNKDIAENFETVIVLDIDGRTHTGTLKSDNEEYVELITAEGNRIRIPQDEIDDISKTKSSMPEDLTKHLTPRDARDLVEFLSKCK